MTDKERILLRIKNSVKETVPNAVVILYGSYARGDYKHDSDIDLLILVDNEKITFEQGKAI